MQLSLRVLVFILFGFLSVSNCYAQLFTNSGTDFWFAFTETRDRANALYWVNITSNENASGTVEIPGTGFTQNFTVVPGQVVEVRIPSTDANILGSAIHVNRGVHVTSNKDVVVFAVTLAAARHEASLVLPNIPGPKRYRVMSHISEVRGNTLYESEFNVVSGGDTVIVDITPFGDIAGGLDSGVTYRDTILPNQVYQAQADSVQDDLTGTLIESVNDKSFFVYSGNVWSSVYCNTGSLDPLYEAMMPTNTWGQDYFAIPTPVINLDYIKIIADRDSTEVFKDGFLVAELKAGEFYDDTISAIHNYTSNKPIALGQFMVTGQNGCTRSGTDPSMIMLNATEQMFLDSISFFAVDTALIQNHYVHTLTRTLDTGLMFLDSTQMLGWTPFSQNADFSYKTTKIAAGYHRLETKGCGFIAYSMGYGSVISYGYAAGVSLVDLGNTIQFSNAINGSDTICLGDTVQFKSTSLERPLNFQWDFGDGSSDTIQSPKHAYTLNGTYVVSLTTTYSCGQITVKDTVEVPPAPIANLGPDTTLCQGDTLTFSVNTSVFKALWNDGSRSKDLRIFKSGNYWVEVSNFCGASRDSVSIVVLTNDLVDAGLDTVLCQFTPYKLGGTSNVPGNLNYLWSPATDLDSANIANPTVTPVNAGPFSYIVSVKSGNCILSDTVDLTVKSKPIIDAGGDRIVCKDTTANIELGGNPTGPITSSYIWAPADKLLNSNTQNPVTKDPFPRTYYLLAVDTSGCTSVDSIKVGTFRIRATGDSIRCGGDTATLRVYDVIGSKPFNYAWSPAANLSQSSDSTPKAFPDSSTNYQIVVSDSLGCIDSATVFVQVNASVKAAFTSEAKVGCEAGIVTASINPSAIFSYNWLLDGADLGSDPVISFEVIRNKDYSLQLAVESVDNCKDTNTKIININETLLSFTADSIANVFTPNYDGINDDIDFTMGNDFVDCSTISVYNRWGALVFQSEEGFPIWDGRTFVGEPCQEGVYFYRLDVNGTSYTGYVTLLR